MCQLTLVNLGNKELNKLYLTTQLLLNTTYTNKDGFGIFSPGSPIYKTEKDPHSIVYGHKINQIIKNDSPVIAHVRFATYTNNVKVVDVDQSHPFESNNFILAHNGTLELKNLKEMSADKYKGLIDSQIFLHRMEEILSSKSKKFPIENLLPLVMGEFYGKFAFLIYDKRTKQFYASRGNSAKINAAVLTLDKNQVGLILNTDDKDLEKNFDFFENLVAVNGLSLNYDDITFTEMVRESIVKINGDGSWSKIGEVRENYKPAAQTEYRSRNWTQTEYWKNDEIKDHFKELDNIPLSITELDELSLEIFGKGLIYLEDDELNNFCEIAKKIGKFSQSGKKKIWEKIKIKSGLKDSVLCIRHNLQYPYMLNTIKLLGDVNKHYDNSAVYTH